MTHINKTRYYPEMTSMRHHPGRKRRSSLGTEPAAEDPGHTQPLQEQPSRPSAVQTQGHQQAQKEKQAVLTSCPGRRHTAVHSTEDQHAPGSNRNKTHCTATERQAQQEAAEQLLAHPVGLSTQRRNRACSSKEFRQSLKGVVALDT